MVDNKLGLRMLDAINFSKSTHFEWDLYSSILKLDEEFGELSENILVIKGLLTHKELKEKSIGEIVDNMIQCCCIVSYYVNIEKDFSDIWSDDLFSFNSVYLEIGKYKDLKETLYFYHKKYRMEKESFIESVSENYPVSMINFKLNIFYLYYIGIILKLMEDGYSSLNDLSSDKLELSVLIFKKELEEVFNLKMCKWKGIFMEHNKGV